VVDSYDKQSSRKIKHVKYDLIEGSQAIDIVRFGCGSRLVTDGYELIFVTSAGDAYIVTKREKQPVVKAAQFESGTRWLKATDSQLVFVNIEGESCILATDVEINDGQLEISIDDLYDSTVDREADINSNGDSFVKFKGTRTIMLATQNELYAKLVSSDKTYQLV